MGILLTLGFGGNYKDVKKCLTLITSYVNVDCRWMKLNDLFWNSSLVVRLM